MIKPGAKFFFNFFYTQDEKKKFRGISGYMPSLPWKSKYTAHALKKTIFAIFFGEMEVRVRERGRERERERERALAKSPRQCNPSESTRTS